MSEDIQILAIKRIDDDRRVAHVRIGEITIRSIWIVDIARGNPHISWPETGKGWPIIEATPELKRRIDQLVLKHAGIATSTPRPARRRSRRRSPSAARAPTEPDFDDPLDDLFGGTPA